MAVIVPSFVSVEVSMYKERSDRSATIEPSFDTASIGGGDIAPADGERPMTPPPSISPCVPIVN